MTFNSKYGPGFKRSGFDWMILSLLIGCLAANVLEAGTSPATASTSWRILYKKVAIGPLQAGDKTGTTTSGLEGALSQVVSHQEVTDCEFRRSERVGFEPTRPRKESTGFRNRLLQPLRHLSTVRTDTATVSRSLAPALPDTVRSPQFGQAAMGFEPMNNGFAIRRLDPLGYAATACTCRLQDTICGPPGD